MKRVMLAALAVVCVAALVRAADKPLWLAVTTPQLAPSIQPLAQRRRAEGLEAVVFVGEPKAALKEHPRPTYLLLVGDAPGPEDKADPAWHVPAVDVPLYRWREEQRRTYASDTRWGELDGDDLPDVAVGRIPVRTPEEAAAVAAKIMAYEDRPWTVDDLRFPMWQGSPNFGPAIDAVTLGMIMSVIEGSVPRWGEPSLVAGLPASPFCGWPQDHAALFNRWLRRGGLMAIIGAHGLETSIFSMEANGEWIGYYNGDVERDLGAGPPTCPIVIVSCLAGNFAARERCLTETLLLAPGGPAAAAGATTESHPMTNALHGLAMARAFDAGPQRLGDFWLAGLRASWTERNLLMETVLANVEGKLEEQIDVQQLRRGQMWMYALLGDPGMRLRIPEKLDATVERSGSGWQWKAVRPPGSTELEVSFRPPFAKLPKAAVDETDAEVARALQSEANSIFSYAPQQSLKAGEAWRGQVDRPGEVRLVAMAPDRWYVAVLKCAE